jgi:hypothetical protein
MKDSLAQLLVDYENKKHEIKIFSQERKVQKRGCIINDTDFWVSDEVVASAISSAIRMVGQLSNVSQESYSEALDSVM